MSKHLLIILAAIAVFIAAVIVYFTTDIFRTNESGYYNQVNVGGDTNQCNCTKRLER